MHKISDIPKAVRLIESVKSMFMEKESSRVLSKK